MNAENLLDLAPPVNRLFDWLLIQYGAIFDTISDTTLALLLQIEAGLEWVPWWLATLAVIGLSLYLSRRWVLSLVMGGLLFLIVTLGLWPMAVETLALVVTAVVIALVIGIPLGILMAEWNGARTVLQPVLDAMQTMPIFVYLIPAMMFFGLGKVPAVLATVIYAAPPVMRLTNLGLRQVLADVQEAAVAYGATRWQLLKEVRLPLALPSIMAGVNQTTMLALSMVVIGSMIGARGLGEEVLLSINRIDVGRGFEAGISVVALAIVMDRLTQATTKRWEQASK